ncbi:SDR family oxidoreductase [Roseateles agri]
MTTANETANGNGVAMVFGGSRGIGAAIARRLAREGYDVALTYVSRPDDAAAVAADIEALGRRALAIRADSADAAALQQAVEQATERFGPLDLAVVNAGVLALGTLAELRLEDLDRMLAVNVRGVFVAIQASAARMKDGGRIITIGSNTAVRTGTPIGAAYAMTKAAVAALVKGVALDLAPRRITVNNVQPGPTETDMTADHHALILPMVPLRRLAEPDEVAGMVAYLASAEAGFVTGASLTIDGGFVL